jgi:hypothetical protein
MTIERLLADNDSTSNDASVIRDTKSGSIVVDYTILIEKLAAAAETIAQNSTTIADNSNAIKTALETIAVKITDIESYQKRLKELGETTGIRVIGPYDWLGLINVYRSLIEQGGILDTQGNVDPAKQSAAESLIASYVSKIQNFPTGF